MEKPDRPHQGPVRADRGEEGLYHRGPAQQGVPRKRTGRSHFLTEGPPGAPRASVLPFSASHASMKLSKRTSASIPLSRDASSEMKATVMPAIRPAAIPGRESSNTRASAAGTP